MPDEPESKHKEHKHDIEAVWSNLRTTQNQVASMGAKLDTLVDSVNMLISKPHKETNWIGVGSLIVALILVVGTYVQARFDPIETIVAKHDTQILAELEASAEHRYNAGERNGKIEAMSTVIEEYIKTSHERLLLLERESASCEATMNAMGKWLSAVDQGGSRKWISRNSGE